jgi:hypothetical protein
LTRTSFPTTPKTFDVDIELSHLPSKRERLDGRLYCDQAEQLAQSVEQASLNFETDRGPHTGPNLSSSRLFEVETKVQEQGQISQLLLQLDMHSEKVENRARSNRDRRRIDPAVPATLAKHIPTEAVATIVEDNLSDVSDGFEDLRIAQIEEELRQLREKSVTSEILKSPVQPPTSRFSYGQAVSNSVPQPRSMPHFRSRRAGRRIQERRAAASPKFDPDTYIPRLIQAVTHLASTSIILSLLAEQPVGDLGRLGRILEGKEDCVSSIADIAGQIERQFPGY